MNVRSYLLGAAGRRGCDRALGASVFLSTALISSAASLPSPVADRPPLLPGVQRAGTLDDIIDILRDILGMPPGDEEDTEDLAQGDGW